MPFTLAHAVVALPLRRTPLVPAAVAVGAMTPDVPLFLRGMRLDYGFTHTVGNAVWTAVIALLLFLVWRMLLRPASLQLAPIWIASRLPRRWRVSGLSAAREALGAGQPRGYPLMLALSLVLGVLSHIVWDMFTHEGRAGVVALPVLAETWGPLPGYKWLQHGSSVICLLVLAVWGWRWLSRRQPTSLRQVLPGWARIAWIALLPVILLSAWTLGYAVLGPFTDDFTVRHLAYRSLPPASAAWAALTAVLCVALLVAARAREVRSPLR